MRTLVTIEFAVFVAVVFGLRSVVQWRATGRTGFVGLRKGARPLERVAGAVMAICFALGPVAPWIGDPLWGGGHVFGTLLALVGIGLTFLAQWGMGASWRIGVDASERTDLVTTGAFAWVRNPIFSAMLVVGVGLAIAVPTPLALLLPPLLLIALELQVRLVEEPYLIRTHGERYLDWASRTGRFVPGVGRLARPRG